MISPAKTAITSVTLLMINSAPFFDFKFRHGSDRLSPLAAGTTVETATHALRLILSGVFEEYPGLKIILGHLGETLPFLLSRPEWTFRRQRRPVRSGFSDVLHV